ncbi:hypothetical protein UFOVP250_146 [uncultured Caudovirales phage]|uniref:Uncharacterized protein n=1 Tax=uncultured Caudovirales phage TaxID=2100421 RepID=A0A6J5LFA8_9CAUD|nr:hypothetical protein UFOVP250_146 [uncultured Caudovirales phage]
MNIIYRLCELEADGKLRDIRPKWYTKQNCLKSFLTAVENAGDAVNKVIFVHDGDGDILLKMIPEKFQVVKIDVKDNLQSLLKTLDIADELGLDDDIYFVEDDYLHLPDSISEIAIAVKQLGLVNGYDHLDRYTRTDDIDYPKELKFVGNHHWRTAEATCCTYAVEKTLFKQLSPTIRAFGLWDRGLFRHFWQQLGVGLWTAVPGLTTQVDLFMSPGVDWEGFNKNV